MGNARLLQAQKVVSPFQRFIIVVIIIINFEADYHCVGLSGLEFPDMPLPQFLGVWN